MSKPKLPVHEISKQDFDKFQSRYLDFGKLEDEALNEIRNLFGITKNKSSVYTLYCDEAHAHAYRCLSWDSPEAGIVERLINEVNNYKRVLEEINDLSKR